MGIKQFIVILLKVGGGSQRMGTSKGQGREEQRGEIGSVPGGRRHTGLLQERLKGQRRSGELQTGGNTVKGTFQSLRV